MTLSPYTSPLDLITPQTTIVWWSKCTYGKVTLLIMEVNLSLAGKLYSILSSDSPRKGSMQRAGVFIHFYERAVFVYTHGVLAKVFCLVYGSLT